MTDEKPNAPTLEDVVRTAAAEARAKEAEREQLTRLLRRPKGKTPSARNETRRYAILRGALPENAAGSLQRLLDRNLEILYVESGLTPERANELLAEFRNPTRRFTTPVHPRLATALGNISEIVSACEEPETAEAAELAHHTGDTPESLVSGRSGARKRTAARQKSADQRRDEAAALHKKMADHARGLLASETANHEVASKVAKKFNVSSRTARNVLQAAAILQPRKKEK